MRYRFGDRVIDGDRREMLGPDGPVHVEPQVFDVIALLLANRDRVVSKAELLDAVWGSRFVSEATLSSRIRSARRATGDDGTAQAVIRTVHGRGYQWVAPVEVDDGPPHAGTPDAGTPDAGTPDAGTADAGTPDAGTADAGTRVRVPPAPTVLLDSFFGRARELAELGRLLERARLVTVVGPGGVGKTRLAREIQIGQGTAGQVPAEHRAAGQGTPGPAGLVALVELAAVGEPEAVGEAVAAALGVQTGQRTDPAIACAEYLADSPALLIVDNCEHLLAPVASFLATLAARCPRLRLLCTSRVPLGLPGEQVYPLRPLPLPDPDAPVEAVRDSPAVALFIARASQAAADLPLDGDTLGRIEALCRSLDGLPLAIEFAASRSAALGLAAVADRLDRRLDLLGADHAGAVRHASLRATIGWSYELLDADAQAVFRALCVFPAGIRLATAEQIAAGMGTAAEGVASLGGAGMRAAAEKAGTRAGPIGEAGSGESATIGDAAAVVARLVRASMLTRTDHPSGARFVPLETVRAFGIDQLRERGELAAAQEVMAGWALRFADEVGVNVHTPDEPYWDDLVRRELPNLGAVRRYLTDQGRYAELIAMLRGLHYWATHRDVSVLWRWQLDLLDRIRDASPELLALALAMAAMASWRSGRLDLAGRLLQEISGLAPAAGWVAAYARDMQATVALFGGRYEEAAGLWLELATVEGLPHLRSRGHALAALSLGYAGELDRARELAAGAIVEAERLGSPTAMAWAYYTRGEVEHVAGSAGADGWLERAVRSAQAGGSSFIAGVATVSLASHRARAGDVATAADLYRRLIAQWLRSGTWTQLWTTLRNAADLLRGHEDEMAVRIRAAAHHDPQAAVLGGDAAAREARYHAEVTERLGQDRVRDLEAEAVATPRAQIAEDAAQALARLAASVRRS